MDTALAEKTGTAWPLFYTNPVLLRFEEHQQVAIAEHDGYSFAKDAIAIPLGIGEFVAASRHYPIVYSGDDGTPLAVVGLKQGENLFVTPSGAWQAGAYVPAYLRRYPFIVTETPDQSAQLLAIDADSDRFLKTVVDIPSDERLFEDDGQPTATARSAMDFCHAYHQEHLRTLEFVAAIKDAGLLAPKDADMRLPDGSRYLLEGFSLIDDAAYRALPLETVAQWHAKGWLDLIAVQQAAAQNWTSLLDLDAKQKQAA